MTGSDVDNETAITPENCIYYYQGPLLYLKATAEDKEINQYHPVRQQAGITG